MAAVPLQALLWLPKLTMLAWTLSVPVSEKLVAAAHACVQLSSGSVSPNPAVLVPDMCTAGASYMKEL